MHKAVNRIIVPLDIYSEVLQLRSQQTLFPFIQQGIYPKTELSFYIQLTKAIVEDILNDLCDWAPNSDKVETLLIRSFSWYLEQPGIAKYYYDTCIDSVDVKLSDMISKYIPYNTNDVWSIQYHIDALVIDNLGPEEQSKTEDREHRLMHMVKDADYAKIAVMLDKSQFDIETDMSTIINQSIVNGNVRLEGLLKQR